MTTELRRGDAVRISPTCVAFRLRRRTGRVEGHAERDGQREYRVLLDGNLPPRRAWFYATDLERRRP